MQARGSFRFNLSELAAILGCTKPTAMGIVEALGLRPARGKRGRRAFFFTEEQVKRVVTEYHRLANRQGQSAGQMKRARRIPTAAARLEALWAKWGRERRAHAAKAMRPKTGGADGSGG